MKESVPVPLFFKKELRDHRRSAGSDSWYGRFCEKCLVAWPCYSFRVAEGRERRERVAKMALDETGNVEEAVKAWNRADKAVYWGMDDMTWFPQELLRTGVSHYLGSGPHGTAASYGLRIGQADYEW